MGETIKPFSTPMSGELAGSITEVQMPDIACSVVKFKAVADNVSNVYVGAEDVTIVSGGTDTTTGLELAPGDETGWLIIDNLNRFWRICDAAGDDLTYMALK